MDRKSSDLRKIYPLFMEMNHSRFVSMVPSIETPTKPKQVAQSNEIQNTKVALSQVEVIKKLMEVYQLLCEISQLINQHFQLQILCFSFNTFLSIVFNVYYILIFRNIIASSSGPEADARASAMESLICFMAISIVGCIMDILCIVCACEHTVNAAKKVSKTVAKMLYKDNLAHEAKEQLSKFALQMVHVFPKFTVYGMFSVDGTLLFTIAGASTTYLIILFQLTLKEDGSSYNNVAPTGNSTA
ncbi:putative gustatory receptor 28b [Culicoides brevitarsis]|uniref:putative gustatory receptor 28b n=1 Tax=Culicoides brevitarsis TaxID=469753 RepID=UPI00307BC93E